MKSNISCINENGQTLIESLIAYTLLFLCTFFVIEIARLLAFKNCLQAATSYIAHKVAYAQIDLLQKNTLKNQSEVIINGNKDISKKISNEMEGYINKISTTLFSYDSKENIPSSSDVLYLEKHHVNLYLKFINNSADASPGVYIESQTCLPVLFSSYFKKIKGNSEVGTTVKDLSRTCLGHFNTSSVLPIFWFRVRVSAYSPWPASTQIFHSGLALPEKFSFLEKENTNDALSAINNFKLTNFFSTTKNVKMAGWSYE